MLLEGVVVRLRCWVCNGGLRRRGLHGDTERVDWEVEPGKVIIHKVVRDGGL